VTDQARPSIGDLLFSFRTGVLLWAVWTVATCAVILYEAFATPILGPVPVLKPDSTGLLGGLMLAVWWLWMFRGAIGGWIPPRF